MGLEALVATRILALEGSAAPRRSGRLWQQEEARPPRSAEQVPLVSLWHPSVSVRRLGTLEVRVRNGVVDGVARAAPTPQEVRAAVPYGVALAVVEEEEN